MGLLDMAETYPELCLCVRLALPFMTELDELRNEAD